jgi:hypothetical protein
MQLAAGVKAIEADAISLKEELIAFRLLQISPNLRELQSMNDWPAQFRMSTSRSEV